MNRLETTQYTIKLSTEELENGERVGDGIAEAANIIANKILKSTYYHRSPRIFGGFYNFDIVQTYHVKFKKISETEISWEVTRRIVQDDSMEEVPKLREILEAPLKPDEFITVDYIFEDHGYFFYCKRSRWLQIESF